MRWSITRAAGEPRSTVPTSDVTALDDAFEARLRAVDDAPVTGPRPLAVAPYRLALARRARGNRYVEAVDPRRGARHDRPLHDRRPADVRAVGHPGPVLGARGGSRVRGGGRGRRPVRRPRRRGTDVGRARPAGGRGHARPRRPRRHPGRRAAAGAGADRRHVAVGRLRGRGPQPGWTAAAAGLGRRHRDVQQARPRTARPSRSTSAAGGSPRPTRAARVGRGCSSPTSASRRSTTCSRSRSPAGFTRRRARTCRSRWPTSAAPTRLAPARNGSTPAATATD